jgi:environmental stress-induced protein Ves
MKIEKISFSELKVSEWSGGTTSEYFIYPNDSSVQAQNFDFRISTASIEIKASNFTQFLNHNRILLILEGETEITHKYKYSKQLKKFDIEYFSGNYHTSSLSEGKVKDFNLIYDAKYSAKVEVINRELNFLHSIQQNQWMFILNYNGELEVQYLNEFYTIESDEMLILYNENIQQEFYLKGNAQLVMSTIQLK